MAGAVDRRRRLDGPAIGRAFACASTLILAVVSTTARRPASVALHSATCASMDSGLFGFNLAHLLLLRPGRRVVCILRAARHRA